MILVPPLGELEVSRSRNSGRKMRIVDLKYREYEGDPREWSLERSELGPINLFVGRNASGKSRTLSILHSFSRLIIGKFSSVLDNGLFEVTFEENDDRYYYLLDISSKIVNTEKLVRNNQILLNRSSDGNGFIRAEELNIDMRFKLQENDIAIFKKRDEIQHPFLEGIHSWANSVRFFQFGSELGRRNLHARKLSEDGVTKDEDNSAVEYQEKVVKTYIDGWEKFGEKFDQAILADLERIGYPCSNIAASHFSQVQLPGAVPVILEVQERDLKAPTSQIFMSLGMYRSLAILIHLNYAIFSKSVSCIIIDDIGEGLDFERSRKIIDVLIEKCEMGKIQLFMSTNDRFVMNEVPINHWQIVERTGSVVRLINAFNSRDKFDEFQYYGLNNFDFFSTKAYSE